MTLLAAAVLGIVEGLTEFLPVSSTGHLILAAKLLRLPDSDFLKSFEIAIQTGAILAVLWDRWPAFFRDRATLARVVAAFVPTALIGFLTYGAVKGFLGNAWIVVAALAVGGAALVLFERLLPHRERGKEIHDLTLPQAALIGACQAVALVPGVSRSAATIVGGLALGMSRAAVVEFSFLLAVPTLGAATAYDLLKSHDAFTRADLAPLAVGFVISFLVARAVLRWFLGYVKTRDFTVFGVYRLLAAGAFWWLILR